VRRYGVDTTWALAVSRVEVVNGDPRAVSSAGAVGIMQVMPAKWFGRFHDVCSGSDLFDVRVNACYGVLILRHYLELCAGDWDCALRRYNGAVTPWKGDRYVAAVEAALLDQGME
jgi:soluble lytic murein transglycosylase-like protein